ncbi:MAG: N-acetylglucosamine-6-phosphate deacetylase [Selenomonas sp.]|nr:N-acetylglucosamine-6-phosphate deacetylase [Selenomonas sp.]MCI6284099.1 N-acetylglucosamine-6-phosphate deacetylase [Selenomonas sp.]
MKAITNGRCILPDKNDVFEVVPGKVVLYDEAGIRAIQDAAAFDATAAGVAPGDVLDAGGRYVSPGFLNVHIHGCGGADTMDDDADALTTIRKKQAEMGVTAFLPTTMTCPWHEIAAALTRVHAAMRTNGQGVGADILGAHMEGPFISPAEKGSQEASNILPADFAKLAPFTDVLRLVTIAPEELPRKVGTDERDWSFIEACERAGIVVSVGHTAADYATAAAAVQAHGVHHFTHLFNAMTGLHHRRPGTVGAALDTAACVELICDNIHVAPAVQRLVWRLKGRDGLILVTDSMSACGIGDGVYEFGGHEVTVTGERALLADGTIAASIATMNRCIHRFWQNTGASIADVITTVTKTPARDLGIYAERGSLAPSKRADLTIFDDDVQIFATIVGGRRVF